MIVNKFHAFFRTGFRMLQGTLPLNHGPAVKAFGSELGEDLFKVGLTITERAEAAGALDPTLITAVDTLLGAGVKLRVFDVEHLDRKSTRLNSSHVAISYA